MKIIDNKSSPKLFGKRVLLPLKAENEPVHFMCAIPTANESNHSATVLAV